MRTLLTLPGPRLAQVVAAIDACEEITAEASELRGRPGAGRFRPRSSWIA
jgi:hypothetical protein